MTSTQSYKDFLLELDRYRNKIIYARITALQLDETPQQSIEGRVTQGSVNLDGSSALRRSCQLTIVADNFNYNDYLWGVNTKFKLEIGVENPINPRYPKVIWFNQGIYLIASFSVNRTTNTFTINIQGKDKMSLLNGDVGGNLTSSVDFGQIEEEDENGNWVIKKIPIPEIIRNMVHVYANEPYHNIVINDLETFGLELLEYRYDIPMYLWRPAGSEIYNGAILENDTKKYYLQQGGSPIALSEIPVSHLDLLVESLVGVEDPLPVYLQETQNGNTVYTPYYFAKIEYGQTAGYRKTDLTYAGDLIANVGETITSVLDKIKNMLVEFEYFYDINGQFIFQKKQSFISTMWGPTTIVLTSNISILKDAIDKLKKDMTAEQYEAYETASGIAWGTYDIKLRENIITYEAFLQKTYEQQNDYLIGLLDKYEALLYSSEAERQPMEQLAVASSSAYTFNGGELILSFNNNPQLKNLKNDYSIWGERESVSGARIPVHLRYAIDEKPTYYKAFNGKIYMTDRSVVEDLKRKAKEEIRNQFYDKLHSFKLLFPTPNALAAPKQQEDGSWSAGWWDIRDWYNYYSILTGEMPNYTMKWYSRNDLNGCVPALSLPITYTSSVNQNSYVWLLIRQKDGKYNAQHGSGNPANGKTTKTLWHSYYTDETQTTYRTEKVIDANGDYVTKEFIPPYSGCSDNHTYIEFLEQDVKRNGNTVFFYNPAFPTSSSFEDMVADKIEKEYKEYEAQGILNYVDWREIIYQMAKDYYKHNTEDTFEMNIALNNDLYYPSGRTGYESYYIDLEGFWRELYYPGLADEYSTKQADLDELNAKVEVLTQEVYGQEVNYSDNNLGGIENDTVALNNYLSDESAKAQSLVTYWNTKVKDANFDSSMLGVDFVAPKYNFTAQSEDGEEILVTDPSLYLRMLQDWYFRRKSDLVTLVQKRDDLEVKVTKLKKDREENYYIDVPNTDIRKYWNKSVYEAPQLLNFWFDFLDAQVDSALGKYSVKNIGARTKSINDTNIKSIYFRETPGVIFINDITQNDGGTGYKYIQVPNIDTMFSVSGQGKSAKERLDELLYEHSYCVESATITTIPVYYLQPNTRIYLYDEDTNLNGDYIISKITIPLSYNGTMSLTTTKAAENII